MVFIFYRCMRVTPSVCNFPIHAFPPLALLRCAAQSAAIRLSRLLLYIAFPSALLAMSTVDSYLKALLALTGNEQLATPRQHLLQGIGDDDLSELLKKAVGTEFARGGLEDIVTVILDVIARDHATASVKNEQVQGNGIQQQFEHPEEDFEGIS